MPTTTTNPYPDVPLPNGAMPGSGDWWYFNNEFRAVHGQERKISGTDVWVQASAIQLPDGSLDDADGPSGSTPGISVQSHWEDNLSSSQARQLAAAILASADELDGWTR